MQDALKRGYRAIGGAAGLPLATPGEKLLGLFTTGNMTTEWTGEEALPYPGNVAKPQAVPGGPSPGRGSRPSPRWDRRQPTSSASAIRRTCFGRCFGRCRGKSRAAEQRSMPRIFSVQVSPTLPGTAGGPRHSSP